MNSIKTIISMIESKAIDDGLKFQNQIDAEAQCKAGEVMREKEYSEWMGKQGFDVLRHANCCKIAFNGGWESQQSKVDELQKRVDAVKKLIQDYKDEEKELELKEWEQSTIYGRIAIELEQALKGEAQ